MDAVNIIPTHNIASHLTKLVAVLRITGVKEHQPVVIKEMIGMTEVLMRIGQRRRTLCLGAIGVYPSMQLHISGVALLYHP